MSDDLWDKTPEVQPFYSIVGGRGPRYQSKLAWIKSSVKNNMIKVCDFHHTSGYTLRWRDCHDNNCVKHGFQRNGYPRFKVWKFDTTTGKYEVIYDVAEGTDVNTFQW